MADEESKALVIVEGTSLLNVTNGHIQLPVSHDLAKCPGEQEALVNRLLPVGVRHEVLSQLQAEEARQSPAQWLVIASVMAISIFLVWQYFPVRPPAMSLESSLKIATDEVPQTSPFYGLFVLSKQLFDEKKYVKCAGEIAPKVKELLENRRELGDSHDRLLYYFFESVRLSPVPVETQKLAERNIDVFASLNADDPKWTIMRVKLRAKEYLNLDLLHSRLCQKRYEDVWKIKLHEVERWVETLRPHVSRVELEASSDEASEEMLLNLAQLKYLQASLLLAQWMLEGGQGKSSFPDDQGSPGVSWREEALRICLEPEEQYSALSKLDRDWVDFLKLRRFIATHVRDNHWFGTSYYWNAQKHWSNRPLDLEIADVMSQLSKKPEGRN